MAQDAANTASPATTSDGTDTALDEIVVTGSRSPQQISQTAHSIHVVQAEQIEAEAKAGKSLQEILGEAIPSFDPASVGARTSYGQNLRGRTALVLIDGVSMNSARGLSRQFDSIDPFNIERVEVLSGATSIYGGNATGGIINIITKKGRNAAEGLHGEVTAGVESGFQGDQDFDRNVGGAVTYKKDGIDGRLSVKGNQTGGYYDGSGTVVIPDITQSSTAFNKRLDVLGNLGFQIDPTRRLEITGQYFESKQDSDYGLFLGTNLAGLRNPSLIETRDGYSSDFNPMTRRQMVNVTYSDQDFLGQELLLQGAYRREQINFHPFPGTAGSSVYFYASEQNTDYLTGKAALIAEPFDRWKITYGIDADRDSLSSGQHIFNTATAASSGGLNFDTIDVIGLYPEIDVTTVAAFAEASFEASDRLTFSGGLRYQYVNTEVGDFVSAAQQLAILQGRATSGSAIPGGEVDYASTLFNAGATYELSGVQQVYGNFSQGFELPDPAKYYGLGVYDSSGNILSSVNVSSSALQAIKNNSFELGYRQDDGTYSFDVAGFYSFADRSINLNRTTLTIDVVNNDRRVYGLEGSAGVQLPRGFDLGVNGQWIRSEVESGDGWTRESVGTASVSKVGAHVGWSDESWKLKLSGQHVFTLHDDSGGVIDDYTLFNLTGSYTFETTKTVVNFGVHNLFDTDYTTIWGSRAKALYGSLAPEEVFNYKGRGRTIALSITKQF